MLLDLNNVTVSYGKIRAISEFSLKVREGELYAILGANGSGKTTLLKTIIGLLRCQNGLIRFLNRDITRTPPYMRARMGISWAPDTSGFFPQMTVIENLRLGAYFAKPEEIKVRIGKVYELFPDLKKFQNSLARSLSGGQQRMLTIGRALMSEPKLLLLDEPSAGLMPSLKTSLFELLGKLKGKVTIIMAEQSVAEALELADRVGVMQTGRLILEKEPNELKQNKSIQKLFFGAAD